MGCLIVIAMAMAMVILRGGRRGLQRGIIDDEVDGSEDRGRGWMGMGSNGMMVSYGYGAMITKLGLMSYLSWNQYLVLLTTAAQLFLNIFINCK